MTFCDMEGVLKRGRPDEPVSQDNRVKAEQIIASAWASAIEKGKGLSSPSKVELELKVGRVGEDGRFTSSVTETEFAALEKCLGNSFSWIALPERVVTDCVVGDDLRLSFDAEGGLVGAMKKTRVSNATTSLRDLVSVRVSLSVETTVALPNGCAIGMQRSQLGIAVSVVRKKARKTFLHRSSRGVFQVDLTRVETEGAPIVSCEVELELMSWALQPHVTDHDRRVWSGGIVEFVSGMTSGQISELKFPSFESM